MSEAEIEQIGPTIGAEIRGLDISQPLDQETIEALEARINEMEAN